MKNNIFKSLTAFAMILLSLTLFACAKSGKDNTATHKIIFVSDGEVYYTAEGEGALEAAEPQKDGYIFSGWYLDENVWTKPYIAEEVTYDITVYANWKILSPPAIYTLTVTVNDSDAGSTYGGGEYAEGESVTVYAYPKDGYIVDGEFSEGKYSFIMPARDTEINVEFYSDGLEFMSLSTSSLEVVNGEKVTTSKLIIPSQISGKKVTKIGKQAFDSLTITDAVLPEGLMSLSY